ncbi:hypothetical protein Pmani_012058 [Petrolisthes manimaculis]|uniref:small monomeric GTPase n=1 Tax=Petrolisthes manimaculis TaxID=1843537 RepID=A0AAE1PXV2_9EUCA|nr:hypothetical protein Pmani_012058 [Petrolisthes manimaculis]
MGFFMSKLQNLFGPEEHKVLILGLNNAGKTTILYKLCLDEVINTTPTINCNVEEIVLKNIRFIMWDVSGQESLISNWSTYYTDAEFVIIVVDSSDVERLSTITVELHKLLSDKQLSKVAGVLIYANKQDI